MFCKFFSFCCSSSTKKSPKHDPAHIKRSDVAPEDMFNRDRPCPPKFKSPIRPLLNLAENQSAHFECRLVPVGDPDMKVDWYKDGVMLQHGRSC